MRSAALALLGLLLGGCQLLTNFVRPLADPPDAPAEDAGPEDAPGEDTGHDGG